MTDAIDDALATCEEAGLVYVCDDEPGIRRRRCGRGYTYLGPDGKTVRDAGERERLAALAVPPAWEDVWICPEPEGHILATGRDNRGRKQYLYHPLWREARDVEKYERIGVFAGHLPDIRSEVDADLRRPRLSERKVVALVVRLLDETLIRVGNAEYADVNESYGLTTLRGDDVEVDGSRVVFDFVGKGGAEHSVAVSDPRLARLVERCEELGGQELFAYHDEEGRLVDVTSTHVNEYLREVASEDFSSKDFRTWGGSVAAAERLVELGPAERERERERNVLAAIDHAADLLGNTRATARGSYVAPQVLDAYRDESLFASWRSARRTKWLRRAEHAVSRIVRD